MNTDNLTIDQLAEKEQRPNQSQPTPDSATALRRTIERHYAPAPGVIPLAVTRAITGRISRMADDHLPLLADLLQRWALPAAGSGSSSWANLPYAVPVPWDAGTTLPGEGIPFGPTPHARSQADSLAAPVATTVGGPLVESGVGRQPGLQAALVTPAVLAPASVEHTNIPLATPVGASSTRRDAAGAATAQPASVTPAVSVPPIMDHTNISLVNPVAAQPARSDAGGSANVQATLTAPVGLASAAVDNSDLPLATPVDAQSVQRNADGSANVQAVLAATVGSTPTTADTTDIPPAPPVGIQPALSDAARRSDAQAVLAFPVGLAPVAVEHTDIPLAISGGAQPVQGGGSGRADAQTVRAAPVATAPTAVDIPDIRLATRGGVQPAESNTSGRTDTQAALVPPIRSMSVADLSVQRSLASEVGDTPLRRRIRVGPPMVEPALSPASAGSTPMLARNSSTLEADPVGWQQTEQTANVTQPTPPDRAQPRPVGPPIVRALDQPLSQAQPEFAPARVGNLYGAAGVAEQPETSNPAAVTPLGRLLDPTRAAVSVHLPNERGGGAQQALLMAKPAEQDGIDALSWPAAPMVVVAGKANTDQEVRSGGLAGHSSTSAGTVAASIDQGSRPASVRPWPDSAQASGSPPVLGKPAPDMVSPDMVWRAIDQSSPPSQEILPAIQPLPDARLAQADSQDSTQLIPGLLVTQPLRAPAPAYARLDSSVEVAKSVQRVSAGALETAAITTVSSEPATGMSTPVDWRTLPTGVGQPLLAAQRGDHGWASELPLAAAPTTGLARIVQTAPSDATSSPGQASAGSVNTTVGSTPTSSDGATSGTASLEAQTEEMIEKVVRQLSREVAIERERQGWQRWNAKS